MRGHSVGMLVYKAGKSITQLSCSFPPAHHYRAPTRIFHVQDSDAQVAQWLQCICGRAAKQRRS